MLLPHNTRLATLIRLIGLGLISWTVFADKHAPGTGGRGIVVSITFGLAAISWLYWTWHPTSDSGATVDTYVMAIAGGVLCGAAQSSAASAFVFVAAVSAGIRAPLARAMLVTVGGTLALAFSALVYDGSALGVLAYTLGFAAVTFAASNARQSVIRAEQAELLLAQTQRSHEEQLRTARLEESTRIAREIHDVLAHALAGLTIQLEATSALIENGADRQAVLTRVRRAHQLAREGLIETRRAVGALRANPPRATSTAAEIQALVSEYRSGGNAQVTVTIDGEGSRLSGEIGQTLVRVVQESLTNVRKHAPGAAVTIELDAGSARADELELIVTNGAPPAGRAGHELLSPSGGGYGLQGMRERADRLGGTFAAGATGDGGWRVRFRVPATAAGTAAAAGAPTGAPATAAG